MVVAAALQLASAAAAPLMLLRVAAAPDARRARRHVVDSVVNIFITKLYASREWA